MTNESKIPELDIEIIKEWSIRGAMLIEGFPPSEYASLVERFKGHVEKRFKSKSVDFLKMIGQDRDDLEKDLDQLTYLFVFNFDLFGDGIDPEIATEKMRYLRHYFQHHKLRELMFARPMANLDYNSRSGYTFHSNHPLGNWCEFYLIQDGKLITQAYPVKHKD